jgi:predicted Rdx family selenoprotein
MPLHQSPPSTRARTCTYQPLRSHNTPCSWRLRLTCLARPALETFARHLESGYEKTRLYLKEVREDKDKTEGLPSAVDLKSSNKLRANVKNPQRKVWPSLVHRHTHTSSKKTWMSEASPSLNLTLPLFFFYRRVSGARGAS